MTKLIFVLIGCLLILISRCAWSQKKEYDKLIYSESFDKVDSLAWRIESQENLALKNLVHNGVLDVNVAKGITIWSTQKFKRDVKFEFEVIVVDAGGPYDHVSDLNCFWMASDPKNPNDFFARSAWRNGVFWNYYSLNLYYVGYGGHNNTKTRFRRYNGTAKPEPAILKEYTDSSHLINPNEKYLIEIICLDSEVSYSVNGEKLFTLHDEKPYKEGYFGFRTINNHMQIESFKVYSRNPKN